MRLGISIAPLQTRTGQPKQYDGIGTYTANVLKALEQRVDIKQVYFKTVRESLRWPLPLYHKTSHFAVAISPFINQHIPIHCYKELERTIDVFHSTDYIIPKFKHTPVVATLHDAIPFKEAAFANSSSRRLKNYLLKSAAQNADHVVTITEAMRSDIHQYFEIPPEKISVLHHGIDKAWFTPILDKSIILKKVGVHKPFLLVVGTISPKKNCLRILQAFSNLPPSLQKEVQLLFVGKKGWDCEAEIELLLKHQEKGTALWLEYVSFDELRTLYQASLALIFPSLHEGFGLPTLEAFASNTPVLTSNIGATAEVAGDAALLIDPLNIDHLTSGMHRLITDESLRKSLVAKGMARTHAFSWEKNATKLIEIYASVAA